MSAADVVPLIVLVLFIVGLIAFDYRRRSIRAGPKQGYWSRFFADSPIIVLFKTGQLKFPVVTISIVAVCFFFFEETALHPAIVNFIEENRLTPATINPLSLTLAQFTHGGWSHLINNMLGLLLFGILAENWLGRKKFLFVYLLCGYVALFSYAIQMESPYMRLLGASANISGVLGVYAFFRVAVWHKIYVALINKAKEPFSSIAYQIFFYGYFLFGDDLQGGSAGIAYKAHIYGTVIALLATFFFYNNVEDMRWQTERFVPQSDQL